MDDEKVCGNCRYFDSFSHNCSLDGEYVSTEWFCDAWWGFFKYE